MKPTSSRDIRPATIARNNVARRIIVKPSNNHDIHLTAHSWILEAAHGLTHEQQPRLINQMSAY